jgi:hypothetical protein
MFKTISAKQINLAPATPDHPIWHRNDYEHILRNPSELDPIANYLLTDPGPWLANPEYISSPKRKHP